MKEQLIQLILKYGIIKTNFKQPITFKSGIKSPIYCNFRECSSYPELMDLICECFQELLAGFKVDGIISVMTGGASHGALLASKMKLPSGYIRPDAKAKDYGLKKLIEGIIDVAGKNIAIIEDLITTGGSLIDNAIIVKKEGANKIYPRSIFSYDTERSKREFTEAGFVPRSLITVHDVLPFLKQTLSEKDYESLVDWVRDPEGWFDRHKTEFEFGFLTQLRQSATENKSIICMGLDPVIEALPEEYQKHGIEGFCEFMKAVFTELMAKGISPAMFKPNLAWWQYHDQANLKKYAGSNSLAEMISAINCSFNNVPICLDFKKGDIGTSSAKWASYGYKSWKANAVTVHSYMGSDSVGPFVEYCNKEKEKGAYLLVKTTNKGASDLELKKLADGRLVYELMAEHVINWAKGRPGVGAVTAGNSPEELAVLGKMFAKKDVPLLIPGVGPSQGGDAGQVSQILRETGYELGLARINLSSGFMPWYQKEKPNPSTNECVERTVNTLHSLNEQVGFTG